METNDTAALAAKTATGVQSFDLAELEEMLADRSMFKDADNLPKWLVQAGRATTYHGAFRVIAGYAKALKAGRSVVIDVRA